MPLVVENGTGVAGANSYIAVAYADTYFADRARSGWTGDTATKEAALINATQYVDLRFGNRFAGVIQYSTSPIQPLAFPRLVDDVSTGIPETLKRATAEYALRALTGELLPDPVTVAGGYRLTSKKSKVGPIEKQETYAKNSGGWIRPYPFADLLLRDLLDPYFSAARVIRN